MSKHTPGPWQVVEKEHTRGACPSFPHLDYFHIQGPQGDFDTEVHIACYLKRADAQLIAAAPDLLEKAKALLDAFGGDTPSWCAAEAQALATVIETATR